MIENFAALEYWYNLLSYHANNVILAFNSCPSFFFAFCWSINSDQTGREPAQPEPSRAF